MGHHPAGVHALKGCLRRKQIQLEPWHLPRVGTQKSMSCHRRSEHLTVSRVCLDRLLCFSPQPCVDLRTVKFHSRLRHNPGLDGPRTGTLTLRLTYFGHGVQSVPIAFQFFVFVITPVSLYASLDEAGLRRVRCEFEGTRSISPTCVQMQVTVTWGVLFWGFFHRIPS